MRFVVFCFLFIILWSTAHALQQVTTVPAINNQVANPQQHPLSLLDSVVMATREHEKFAADSMAMQYIKYPDSAINREAVIRTLKENLYTGHNFLDIPFKPKGALNEGSVRKTRDQWVIVIIIGLLIYTALLNITINKDVNTVLRSFYSKRVTSQAGKEEGFINFWSFVGLFLLFGFTLGLFLYQLAGYSNKYFSISGVRLFVSLSFIVLALCAIKFLVLKIIGFIFDINKQISEYVSILYLTYFNIAFIFLPVILSFSLLEAAYIPLLLSVATVLIIIVFTWLYLRSSVNIISNFRFHKFYLFIYLCALEICPILILIKALNA
jgi:hypothetical protein